MGQQHSNTYNERLRIAFKLALDLDTCRRLLNDEPVDPARLDQAALDHAKAWQLVRFDQTMFDVYADTLASVREAA